MRLLILSVLCVLLFGFTPDPKPALKGSWFCCWPTGYVEMHFSKNRLQLNLPNSKQLYEYKYKLKADTLFMESLEGKELDFAILKFQGKDTLHLFFPKLEESYDIYRLKMKVGNLKDSEKLLQDSKVRAAKANCIINKQDTLPFIYFQF